ncbi:MAG: aspartate--tRNA ligase, partial [Sphingomonadaceae bacterium]
MPQDTQGQPDPALPPYRTHHCGQLRREHVGRTVRLSGWVHRKRDHGGLLFVDLRDHYGLTQLVAMAGSESLIRLEHLRLESVVTITGEVVARTPETVNPDLATGDVEVRVRDVVVQSEAAELPMPVATEADYPEDIRLRYRFLDLRRERLHQNILLRSQVIASLRQRMIAQGFTEFQTPILTASSPEGARDFLVPSRLHPGKFYALPQAPQMFKQLVMVAGFDRYFQIAPCFRDEDARADRSPGEFYQLDFEMSFVTQEDVFAAIEPVLAGVFEEFAGFRRAEPWSVTEPPFPRIPYAEAMLRYGSDKPDLRNPLLIQDVSDHFRASGFALFEKIVDGGGVVRAIPAPATAGLSRKFFDDMNEWARSEGFAGLGYVTRKGGAFGGPIARNHGEAGMAALYEDLGLGP